MTGPSENASRDHRTESLSSAQVALIDFIAGSFGGVGTVLVGQPFDTVKVLGPFMTPSRSLINI